MKAHIVLAHPEANSFNGLLAGTSRRVFDDKAWDITLSDLYAMGFNPSEGPDHYATRKDPERFHVQTEQRYNADSGSLPPEIEAEVERLGACDLLIVHFPLWWFGMPAILKGWMDRVFVYGRMYRSAMRYDKGICAGKRMIACVTTGASAESCAHNGREGDTKLHLWPILFPFRYLGFEVFEPEILHGVGGVSFMESGAGGENIMDAYRRQWEETLGTLESRARVRYNSDADFDQSKQLVPGAVSHSPFVRQSP